jgi:general secretion pathway protein M
MRAIRFPSRWLALALLLGLVAAPLAGLGLGWAALERAEGAEAALADTAARVERVAASRGDLVAQRDALKAGLGQGARFLGGANAAISGADLQRLVGEVATRSQAQIDNALVLPAREEGAYLRIGLRVTLSTRIGPLQHILYQLESGQPSLFIDSLQIRADDAQGPDPGLSVSFDVYGYRPGAGGPA